MPPTIEMATSIGKNLGNYTVEGEIGSGGMGELLLARQTSLDRPAVLKKIRRDLCELPELVERLEREARAAAAIHHPNVVAVYDCFSVRGNQYIAQEFVDGVDLRTVLDRCGALPWRIAGLIALEVARGLEEIHSLGTVHRDLKPQNIMIGRRGEVKIADFGLALEASGSALTLPGVMIGSPSYMPPEQMMGERVDGRCDLFSWGVVFYEALTNRLPYPESDPKLDPKLDQAAASNADAGESLLARMQRGRYPKLRKLCPTVPRDIVRLIQQCLRPKVKQRLASTAALRRRLEGRIGALSPADLRGELATWLWERQVFETRKNETVVLAVRPAPRVRRSLLRGVGLAAAILVATAAYHVDAWPKLRSFFASPAAEGIEAADQHGAEREASEFAGIAKTFSLARTRFAETLSGRSAPDAD